MVCGVFVVESKSDLPKTKYMDVMEKNSSVGAIIANAVPMHNYNTICHNNNNSRCVGAATITFRMMWVDLPDTSWNIILSYVGNTKDFRSCEKTCRSLRRILSNEAVWNIWESQWAVPSFPIVDDARTRYSLHHVGDSPWIPPALPTDGSKLSLRENCLAWQAFVSYRLSGKSTDSIMLSVIGMTRWKQLVKAVMAHRYADVPFQASNGFRYRTSNHTSNVIFPMVNHGYGNTTGGEWGWGDMRVANIFTLRGDGSSALLSVVETAILTQLRRAMLLAINAERVMVTISDYAIQGQLFPTDGYLSTFNPEADLEPHIFRYDRDGIEDTVPDMGLSGDEMRTMACRFAARAGIVSMDNTMYAVIWRGLVDMILLIMRRVSIELSDREQANPSVAKAPLRAHESISDVAPYPNILGTWDCCGELFREHVVVPRQIEKAAEFYRITRRVLNVGWHVSSSVPLTEKEYVRAVAAERAIAEKDYVLIDGDASDASAMGSGSFENSGSDYSMGDDGDSDEELSTSFVDTERFHWQRQCDHSERTNWFGTESDDRPHSLPPSVPTMLDGDQRAEVKRDYWARKIDPEKTQIRFWCPWLNDEDRSERPAGLKLL